jgi:membrane-bound lytic murein transglycosylase B
LKKDFKKIACVWLVGVLLSAPVYAGFDNRDDVSKWLANAGDLGFTKAQVAQYLAQTTAKPSIVPVLRNAPERKLLWSGYQQRLVTPQRIKKGQDFVKKHAAQLSLIAANTGVDAAIIGAIAGIESDYGANMGQHLTLPVLATLSFDYPRRSEFYQRQLAQFFRLSHSQGIDPMEVKGSAAGAVGMGQFIPTSYRDFAVDGDGDGRIDLFHSSADNLASIANYLARHGWRAGEPWLLSVDAKVEPDWLSKKSAPKGVALAQWQLRGIAVASKVDSAVEFNLYAFSTEGQSEYRLGGANFYAITRYNHSLWYSRAVVEIAQGIAQGVAQDIVNF